MNKLNQLGMSAIEFRKEFWNKNYPELVHDSIGFAIDKNFEDCPAVLEKIKDYACSDREFEKFLLTQDGCVKSYEELLAEFDALKDALNLDGIDVETVSEVQSDYISVKKEFLLHENFLRNYFYIESDAEFDKLMSRKGFVEKFAILRLKRIIADFVADIPAESAEKFAISNTPVFFNSEKSVYGIFLEMKVPVDLLETPEKVAAISVEASQIIENARTMFEAKMKI